MPAMVLVMAHRSWSRTQARQQGPGGAGLPGGPGLVPANHGTGTLPGDQAAPRRLRGGGGGLARAPGGQGHREFRRR